MTVAPFPVALPGVVVLRAADMDTDGDLDLLASTVSDPPCYLLRNDAGTFTANVIQAIPRSPLGTSTRPTPTATATRICCSAWNACPRFRWPNCCATTAACS